MLSVQTLTFEYNCPACKAGRLEFSVIDSVSFEPNEEHKSPIIMNLTGEIKCNNCGVVYKWGEKNI